MKIRKRILTSLLSFVFLFSFFAITPVKAATNLALGKMPTSSVAFTNLSRVTDGNKGTNSYADSYTNSGVNWIQLDLGDSYSFNQIKLWHYYGDGRKYHDVVVQLSNDPTFTTGLITLFNNDTNNSAGRGAGSNSEYTETTSGLNLSFNAVNARYARFYSNGSNVNAYNHYVEIEIYQSTVVTNNLAYGLTATTSKTFSDLPMITDGVIDTNSYADSYTNSGLQWIQLDLGASYSVNQINLWHYYGDGRKYHDVVVQLSNDPTFTTGVSTVFNNDTNNSAGRGTGSNSEYTETSSGLNLTFNAVNARYARFYSSGSNINAYNHYVEVEIYQSSTQVTNNLASGITASTSKPFSDVSMITDGIIDTNSYADSYTNSGLQWIQLDLGASYFLNNIKVWHYFGDPRKYHDVIVQISDDASFSSNVRTVYNNDTDNSAGRGTGTNSEYAETSKGLNIDFSSTSARYVRLYSNGSTSNAYNHYVEVEVYALAAPVAVESVSLNKNTDSLEVGGTDTLTATITPSDASNKNVTWSSDNTSVATVDNAGIVKGVSAGTANITVTTEDGGKIAKCIVTVQSNQSGNLSNGIMPTGSTDFTNPAMITDGNTATGNYSDSYPSSGLQWIQIDLKSAKSVNNIKLWHYYGDGRKYRDVIIQISNDPAFSSGVTTVFNNDSDNSSSRGTGSDNEYSETSSGLTVKFNTINARYVRFYSNGCTSNNYNHYVEAQINYDPSQSKITDFSNLASARTATTSKPFTNLSYITDGNTDTRLYSDSYQNSGLQWIQIDLGANYNINNIKLWHYYGDSRQYHDVIIQVSKDPDFSTGVITVYNNDTNNTAGLGTGNDSEYAETSSGSSITFTPVNARYVRLYSNGNTVNKYNHYVEVQVYDGVTQIHSYGTPNDLAANITPTSSAAFSNLAMITDGDKNITNYSDSYPQSNLQWIQVDLGASFSIDFIKLWHYYGDPRKYHDVIIQVSNDPNFASGVITVYSNDTNNSTGLGKGSDSEYAETVNGLEVTFDPIKARYVRCYSNGNTVNTSNHYTELEVYSLSQRTTFDNASEPLFVPTYDGGNQSVHPSVVYFKNGWNGYKYWMVSTPYPFYNDSLENPSVNASNDGVNWEVPAGLKNPLATVPSLGHNCDPELFYNAKTNELWIYYLEANDVNTTYVKFLKSSNGVTWTTPKTIITDSRSAYETISPTVDYNSVTRTYYMWSVNLGVETNGSQDNYLELRTSTDGVNWSAPTKLPSMVMMPYEEIWHIYIRYIPAYKQYWCIFAAYPDGGDGGSDTILYFARSTDGINWQTWPNQPILSKGVSGAWDEGNVYRSSFIYYPESDLIKIWYSSVSAGSAANQWHIGLTTNNFINMYYNLVR
jgi:uncharacterized protein YjdB